MSQSQMAEPPLAAISDPLNTFQLPSELSALLSLADQAKVLAKIREIHVRLAERDPELEDNRCHGHHLWLVYDAMAEATEDRDDFRNYVAPRVYSQDDSADPAGSIVVSAWRRRFNVLFGGADPEVSNTQFR